MRYIAAPWRADYVRRGVAAKSCVFCEARKGRDDRGAGVLFRGRHHIVMLNKYPYTPGHLMIAPRRHVADFVEARPAERAELADLLQVALRVLGAAYGPQGFNTGMNLGASAGAGVAGHYHLHVVPRWTGDCELHAPRRGDPGLHRGPGHDLQETASPFRRRAATPFEVNPC